MKISNKTKKIDKQTVNTNSTATDIVPLETPPELVVFYNMIREQIRHEDNLVNQRLTWLLAIEAFLFAGFAAILTSGGLSVFQKESFALIIGGFGISFCLISTLSIHAAFVSLKILREKWYETPKGNQHAVNAWIKARAKYPPITYVGRGVMRAGSAAYGTPTLIILAWIFILLMP